jgi:hypothetical protein
VAPPPEIPAIGTAVVDGTALVVPAAAWAWDGPAISSVSAGRDVAGV